MQAVDGYDYIFCLQIDTKHWSGSTACHWNSHKIVHNFILSFFCYSLLIQHTVYWLQCLKQKLTFELNCSSWLNQVLYCKQVDNQCWSFNTFWLLVLTGRHWIILMAAICPFTFTPSLIELWWTQYCCWRKYSSFCCDHFDMYLCEVILPCSWLCSTISVHKNKFIMMFSCRQCRKNKLSISNHRRIVLKRKMTLIVHIIFKYKLVIQDHINLKL